ncbi:YidH family protein [Planctomyces sp. SH-PL62]|uniref:YidH family protein n=1 Tax=Planctomyces sp. SH-PL62 TaxID=1636152 RepID=UPI00078C0AEC|nr:DUF202 domain-containing protein [Planctomyces sp. SH-PL62]AMV36200.1 hypothetical protein VT85_02070 [Planctomyces sp. SH-PL62]
MQIEPNKPAADPRVYLAAERTYLAWVRTSLGLMGFGFLIARFGFLIEELEAVRPSRIHHSLVPPLLGGTIVLFGVCVCVVAAFRHRAYVEALRGGDPNPELHLRTPLVVAWVLALAGLAMTFVILTS